MEASSECLSLPKRSLFWSFLRPYLRIPLLLSFFTDRHRASALREPQLQVVLDAVLFEPGPWLAPGQMELPSTVPAPNRRPTDRARTL